MITKNGHKISWIMKGVFLDGGPKSFYSFKNPLGDLPGLEKIARLTSGGTEQPKLTID
jgi:hypothetical protein